jgi:hypothetical protein
MANQVEPATSAGTVPGTSERGAPAYSATSAAGHEPAPFVSQVPGTPVSFPSFHGRTVSWVAVSLIMAAFVIGGLALVLGPLWWLFWVSIALAVVGALLALGTGIMDDWY